MTQPHEYSQTRPASQTLAISWRIDSKHERLLPSQRNLKTASPYPELGGNASLKPTANSFIHARCDLQRIYSRRTTQSSRIRNIPIREVILSYLHILAEERYEDRMITSSNLSRNHAYLFFSSCPFFVSSIILVFQHLSSERKDDCLGWHCDVRVTAGKTSLHLMHPP